MFSFGALQRPARGRRKSLFFRAPSAAREKMNKNKLPLSRASGEGGWGDEVKNLCVRITSGIEGEGGHIGPPLRKWFQG